MKPCKGSKAEMYNDNVTRMDFEALAIRMMASVDAAHRDAKLAHHASCIISVLRLFSVASAVVE